MVTPKLAGNSPTQTISAGMGVRTQGPLALGFMPPIRFWGLEHASVAPLAEGPREECPWELWGARTEVATSTRCFSYGE